MSYKTYKNDDLRFHNTNIKLDIQSLQAYHRTNIPLKQFLSLNTIFQPMLLEMSKYLLHNFKYQLLDIRVQNLLTGQYTSANDWWHTDGSLNSKDEHYVLFCLGSNRTQFITENVKIDYKFDILKNDRKMSNYVNHIQITTQNLQFHEILESQIAEYSSQIFHRGVQVQKPGKRLLLRICESDFIKYRPLNQEEIKKIEKSYEQ